MEANSNLKDIFLNVNDWLKFAEAKNAIIVGFDGAVIFGIARLSCSSNPQLSIPPILLYMILISFFIGMLIALWSFLPRTAVPWHWFMQEEEPQSTDNLLFFGDIRKYEAKAYVRKILDNSEPNKLEIDYGNQIIFNSKIAYKKFQLFKWSLYFNLFPIFILFISIIISVINFYKG